MDDAALVCVVHRTGRVRHQSRRRPVPLAARGFPAAVGERLREIAAVDQLHAEVVLSLVLADLVDRYQPGMAHLGGCVRLVPEALHVARRRQLAR